MATVGMEMEDKSKAKRWYSTLSGDTGLGTGDGTLGRWNAGVRQLRASGGPFPNLHVVCNVAV